MLGYSRSTDLRRPQTTHGDGSTQLVVAFTRQARRALSMRVPLCSHTISRRCIPSIPSYVRCSIRVEARQDTETAWNACFSCGSVPSSCNTRVARAVKKKKNHERPVCFRAKLHASKKKAAFIGAACHVYSFIGDLHSAKYERRVACVVRVYWRA